MRHLKWNSTGNLELTELSRTNPNIYVEGRTGVGKTRLVNSLIKSILENENSDTRVVVYTHKKDKYCISENSDDRKVYNLDSSGEYCEMINGIEDKIKENIQIIKEGSEPNLTLYVIEDIDLVHSLLQVQRGTSEGIYLSDFRSKLEYFMRLGPSSGIYFIITGQEDVNKVLNENTVTQIIKFKDKERIVLIGYDGTEKDFINL